jgi:tetratricopeptide (TPR) repeat protein
MKGLFGHHSRKRQSDSQELLQTIFAFIQARTWDKSRRVVAGHPELLTDEADDLMGRLVDAARAQGDENGERVFEEHRALLRRCREVGVAAAFAEKMTTVTEEQVRDHPLYRLGHRVMQGDLSLEHAVQEAQSPSTLASLDDEAINRMDDYTVALSRDPTRPTEVRVLAYVLAELNHAAALALPASPPIRAYTANTLGNRIDDHPFKTPTHLKRRVEAYQSALAVWQEQGNQEKVAMLQNNLGNAYSDLAQVREREANLQRAIDAYRQALHFRTPETAPLEYATTQNNLGSTHVRLAQVREWEENLLRAIDAYRQALRFRTPEMVPLEYATTQNNLGLAYSYLAQVREREENLLRAIDAYRQALRFHTPETAPLDFATAQNNLGLAYSYLAQVREREENLLRAIEAYHQALHFCTPEAAPMKYAGIQNNLGNAYSDLAQVRDRKRNLLRAVDAFRQALTVYTPQTALLDFATTQNNLGLAYSLLAQVFDWEENLLRAIDAYRQALTVYTLQTGPLDFAMLQNNLGNAYSDLAQVREREENLLRAIDAYHQALTVYTPEAAPLEYARTQNNLGNTYSNLAPVRERKENLLRAIDAFQQALTVYVPKVAPSDFAMTQNNLGNAYFRLADVQEQEANLGRAIDAYRQALTVYTLQTAPLDFAMTQNNLGNAYSYLAQVREREKNLLRAIDAYHQALTVYTPEAAVLEYAGTQNNLGLAHFDLAPMQEQEANLERAIEAYCKAQVVIDAFFLAASVGAQLGIQGRWVGLASRTVAAYRQVGQCGQALAAAEGTKSRLLTTYLGRGALPAPAVIPPALMEQERALADQLNTLDAADLARHDVALSSAEETAYLQRLEQRQALVECLRAAWQEMEAYGPQARDYVALRRGDRPDWEDLAHLAADLGGDTALLSLFTTGERTLLFVLRDGMDVPQVVEAPLDGTAWQGMMRRFLREVHFYDGSGRRGETWLRPLLPLLEAAAPHLPGARRVIFAPEARGHLLPWGLLARRAGWEAPVVTVPALGMLERVLRRPMREGAGALVVGNPTGDIPYAELEARRVAAMLGVERLVGPEATREAVLTRLGAVRLAHFATHAYFDPGSPLDSGIVLADGVLTAREILERELRAPEFLALSACQTGMAGTLGGDEMAGLSQALLHAGARALLVSLWAVNDPATAHLMTGFYRRWREEGQDKAVALRDAMDATRQARPAWAHTYYWGAFTLVGDWRA